MHQRARRAVARLHLGELEPEARAVTRFAERIAPLHDHLDQFVEHSAADTDRPAGMGPGAVAGEAERALRAAAARRVDVEIVGHVRRHEQFVALAERVVEAAGGAQAEHVPIAHQLDGRAADDG